MRNYRQWKETRWPTQPSMPTEPSSNPLEAGNIRETILRVTNLISNFEPRDVTDTKDLLLDLKHVVEDRLTGV